MRLRLFSSKVFSFICSEVGSLKSESFTWYLLTIVAGRKSDTFHNLIVFGKATFVHGSTWYNCIEFCSSYYAKPEDREVLELTGFNNVTSDSGQRLDTVSLAGLHVPGIVCSPTVCIMSQYHTVEIRSLLAELQLTV